MIAFVQILSPNIVIIKLHSVIDSCLKVMVVNCATVIMILERRRYYAATKAFINNSDICGTEYRCVTVVADFY